jgi:carboxymethylenebutenolidase
MTHNLTAETITIPGHNGDAIEAYIALPTDALNVGSVVVIHHLPGYDEATKEICRKFAANGYAALMPNLYHRVAPGADPDDAAATARAQGGMPDDQVVGDVAGARTYLQGLNITNGKAATIGYCSGGRQSFMAGCRLPFEAVIDCYGAFVALDTPEDYPLKMTSLLPEVPGITGRVLGLFGADDQYPSVEQNDTLAAVLREADKDFIFHTFDGAGHAFFNVDRPSFRPEAAQEGWAKIWQFLSETIA